MGPGALRRGLHIVNLLRRQGGTLSVAAIAKATGLPRPTAYRLLDVLESEGYVRRDDTGKRFALGSPDVSLGDHWQRSEEHTSELQSLMRISYAAFCLKK